MEKSLVTVVPHPETGEIVTRSHNEDFGVVRLDQSTIVKRNNFVARSRRTVFLRGEYDLMVELYGDKKTVPGKIIMRESFHPFYPNQEPKRKGAGGDIILTDGKPTYIEFVYDEFDVMEDEWVDTPTSDEVISDEVISEAEEFAEQTM